LNKIETAHHTEDQLKYHLADPTGPKQTAEVVVIRMPESPRPQYFYPPYYSVVSTLKLDMTAVPYEFYGNGCANVLPAGLSQLCPLACH